MSEFHAVPFACDVIPHPQNRERFKALVKCPWCNQARAEDGHYGLWAPCSPPCEAAKRVDEADRWSRWLPRWLA